MFEPFRLRRIRRHYNAIERHEKKLRSDDALAAAEDARKDFASSTLLAAVEVQKKKGWSRQRIRANQRKFVSGAEKAMRSTR